MRLSVQGCLILWLCLLASTAHAAWSTDSNREVNIFNSKQGALQHWETELAGFYCGNASDCYFEANNVVSTFSAKEEWRFYQYTSGEYQSSEKRWIYKVDGCLDPDLEEDENGNCVTPTQEPEECYENGEIYDAQNQTCVTSCPEGSLNGVCLELPANNEENCDADSPDYQGFIGNGNTKMNLCESNRQCDGGAFGVVNGTPACIPDEYGPPTCKVETVAVIDEYGFVCADPQDAPEPGQEPDEWWKDEEPNTDTDGDGEPDEYDPGNDPTSVDKGINQVNQGVSETNDKLDGANDRLDKIGKGIAKSNELQDEANGVADDARDTLKEINEKLDGPEDGYDTTGLGEAATFGDTATRLQNAISNHPTIQAVTHIPSVASNYTCPTWTIPSNDYFGPLTFDTHCAVFNDYRGQLSILFILVWTLSAVMIFLRA